MKKYEIWIEDGNGNRLTEKYTRLLKNVLRAAINFYKDMKMPRIDYNEFLKLKTEDIIVTIPSKIFLGFAGYPSEREISMVAYCGDIDIDLTTI